MAKRSIRRPQIANSKPTGDKRGPVVAELPVPRSLPEDIAKDPGYLALRLTGLSDLVRSASAEDQLSPEAGFFVAATLDDVAARLAR